MSKKESGVINVQCYFSALITVGGDGERCNALGEMIRARYCIVTSHVLRTIISIFQYNYIYYYTLRDFRSGY